MTTAAAAESLQMATYYGGLHARSFKQDQEYTFVLEKNPTFEFSQEDETVSLTNLEGRFVISFNPSKLNSKGYIATVKTSVLGESSIPNFFTALTEGELVGARASGVNVSRFKISLRTPPAGTREIFLNLDLTKKNKSVEIQCFPNYVLEDPSTSIFQEERALLPQQRVDEEATAVG